MIKNKLIILKAVFLIVILMLISCKNDSGTQGNKPEPNIPDTPKASFDDATGQGSVNGIEFKLIAIESVQNGNLGFQNIQDNEPHKVNLTAYKIGETEVTQELFNAVMGANPSFFDNTQNKTWPLDEERDRTYITTPFEGEEHSKRPVEHLSWFQAVAFCNKLSLLCGREACYSLTLNDKPVDFLNLPFDQIPITPFSKDLEKMEAIVNDWNGITLDIEKNGFRLPTEAEWEWAAKGGTEDYYAGTSDIEKLKDYAWYDSDNDLDKGNHPDARTHEVKKKEPNAYGLYDMTGNVWEWVWDQFGGKPADGETDPLGYEATENIERVVRGGSWNEEYDTSTRFYRYKSGPSYPTPDSLAGCLGFRIVCRTKK